MFEGKHLAHLRAERLQGFLLTNNANFLQECVMEEAMEMKEVQSSVSRRAFLTRAAVAGAGIAALGVSGIAEAAMMTTASNERQYRTRLFALGSMSMMTSQIALNKASDAAVRQFANFEFNEQTAVANILTEMNTPKPPMDAEARAVVARLRAAPRGRAFDREYILAQHNAHLMLRSLNTNYVANSRGRRNMREMHARHLAMLALPAINEHIAHTTTLRRTLGA
jgi:putative membrane protein